jgi:hypothetical protein
MHAPATALTQLTRQDQQFILHWLNIIIKTNSKIGVVKKQGASVKDALDQSPTCTKTLEFLVVAHDKKHCVLKG